jgi:hypothetical protein
MGEVKTPHVPNRIQSNPRLPWIVDLAGGSGSGPAFALLFAPAILGSKFHFILIDSTDKTGFSRLFLFFLFYAVVSIARGFFE